jgi:cell division protein FtsB
VEVAVMARIGSIFAEQLRRCKERLSGSTESEMERLFRVQGENIQRLLMQIRELQADRDRLQGELRYVSHRYAALRRRIWSEIISISDKQEEHDGEDEVSSGEVDRTH